MNNKKIAQSDPFIVASRGRYVDEFVTEQKLEPNFSGTTNTITTVQKDNYVCEPYEKEKSMEKTNEPVCLNSKGGRGGVEGLQPSIQDRVYDSNAISTAVTTSYMPSFTDKLRIRKLTPKECFRLMGFDDADFEKAEKVNSNSQLYKQAGNSIVVDVLEKIFGQIFDENGEICV